MPFQTFKMDGKSTQLDGNTQVMEYLGRVDIPIAAWPDPIATGPTGAAHYYTTTSITLPSNIQMLCVANTNGAPLALNKTKLSGSNRVFTFSSSLKKAIVLHTFGPRNVTTGNFGLQLLNSAGTVVFDSTSKFLRIHSVITPTSENQIIKLPQTVGTLAVGLGNHQSYIRGARVGQRPAFIVVRRAIIVKAGQVTMSEVTQHGPPSDDIPKPTPVPPMPPMLVVNVSNY